MQAKKKKKGASEEEHAAIGLYMRFYQSLSFLNFSLSLFLKTEFLFGKTNRVKFHEKFLTPYMKLEVLQIKQTNKVFDFTTLNRSEEHTSELQSRRHISYAVFCLKMLRPCISFFFLVWTVSLGCHKQPHIFCT